MYRLNRLLLLAGAMLIGLGLSVGCSVVGKDTVQPGSQAPEFALEAVRGGSYRLRNLQGSAVLISFIDTQARAADTPDPSRSQIVFLKSMLEQYGVNGLVVLIVDAAHLRAGGHLTLDSLINFTYDWELAAIPVLIDPVGRIAYAYGITDTPTTFLIGKDGMVRQRWEGLVTAPQLAFAIEDLIESSSSCEMGKFPEYHGHDIAVR